MINDQLLGGSNTVSAAYIQTVVVDKLTLHEAILRNQFFTPGLKSAMMTVDFMKKVSEGKEWLPKCSEIRIMNCADPPPKLAIAEILYQKMMHFAAQGEPFDTQFRLCAQRLRKSPPETRWMLALLSTIDSGNELFGKAYKKPKVFSPFSANPGQEISNKDGFFSDLPLAAKQSRKKQVLRFHQVQEEDSQMGVLQAELAQA